MISLEPLYRRLPWSLQNIACTVEGWRIQRSRFGAGFAAALRHAEERLTWSDEKLLSFRDECVLQFARQACAAVPFYRERMKVAGMAAEDIRTLDDIGRLPVLSREEAQAAANAGSLYTDARPHHLAHTSGSTGTGFVFRTTPRAVQEQWATWWRYRLSHGIRLDTWCAYFGGRLVVPIGQKRAPFWRVNRAGRQVLFSGYHLGPDTATSYVEELRRRKLPWLHGYPSLLAALASMIVEQGLDLGYRPRWITTGAESLLPHQKAAIRRAFGVSPVQHYGMAEAAANSSECGLGRQHIDEDFAFVEFVATDIPDVFRVIGTNFSNLATPLIRYDTGDLATCTPQRCECGRSGRIIQSLDGRREDYIVLSNGTVVGRLDHVFKDLVHMREGQIHQTHPGQISVRVVRGAGWSASDEAILRHELGLRLGPDTKVEIAYLHEIPRSGGGKLRLVVSDLPHALPLGSHGRGQLPGSPTSTAVSGQQPLS